MKPHAALPVLALIILLLSAAVIYLVLDRKAKPPEYTLSQEEESAATARLSLEHLRKDDPSGAITVQERALMLNIVNMERYRNELTDASEKAEVEKKIDKLMAYFSAHPMDIEKLRAEAKEKMGALQENAQLRAAYGDYLEALAHFEEMIERRDFPTVVADNVATSQEAAKP